MNQKSNTQLRESVSYFELFRYATNYDIGLMILGTFGAIVTGAQMPMFSLIFGEMANSFSSDNNDEILKAASLNSLFFLIIAIAALIFGFFMFSTFTITGERQGIEFRRQYFKALLNQEVGWFDSINANELNSKIAGEVYLIQDAISQKYATMVQAMSTLVSGICLGYIKGWLLALVISSCMPFLAISVLIISAVQMNASAVTTACESAASAHAEQALGAIKTVKMLDGEEHECKLYSRLLQTSASTTIKYSLYQGLSLGLIFGEQMWAYALGFWYGAKLIADQTTNSNGQPYLAGDVLVIFLSVLMGSFSLGNAAPCLASFAKGRQAAAKAFEIIDRQPIINKKEKIRNFNGEIEFQDIHFNYPQKPEIQILQGVSLNIEAGKKIALVGASGCGKSTIFQLIERFYDPQKGTIYIGKDKQLLQDVDLIEYRSLIGMVGQEPVLFAGSIRENLQLGKPDATDEEMIEQLKKVNAWEFVERMDKGLDTFVGVGGSQLSGGQKQRIAIARSLMKQPKLLLLDEATSALDRANEKLIQSTLDSVSQGITTIIIAHRLSTIQNADVIYVFDQGKIVESGTHQHLYNIGGHYTQLCLNQVTQVEQQQSSIAQSQRSLKSLIMNPLQQENGFVEEIIVHSKDVEEIISDRNVMIRLFSYNKQERGYFIVGIFAALVNGCMFPVFSLFLSDLITILIESNPYYYEGSERGQKVEEMRQQSDQIALIFFLLGVGYWACTALENFCLNVCAERLTLKLRKDAFRKLLRMPIPYFDVPENNAGTLTARLAVDCKILQGLTSTILGFKVQNFSALICGMTIAFVSSWALTLIALAISPISFISKVLRQKYFVGTESSVIDSAYKDSGNLIMESVTNIRTVYSFGNEKIILRAYDQKVKAPMLHAQKQGILAGFSFGTANMQLHLINAIIFYLGTLLIVYWELDVNDMYRCIFGITFAVMGGAKDSHFAQDIDKSTKAAIQLFKILDSKDEYDFETKKISQQIQGDIEFQNVSFTYASRETKSINNLNLKIQKGQKIGFVGPSGCGKSTIMQMLMRFYEPQEGIVKIDGINIQDYDIRHLRRSLAIVSQEPVLFNGSVSENIKYNIEATDTQIEDAANQANYIQDQVEGLKKQVGLKGSQISGGQKQRIAIARAMLRNSNILLLDEATSALDSKTEESVQESLNQFMKNKTTITIAHRISTIKDSDQIFVFQDGKIVEQGPYNQLVSKKGTFYKLEQGLQL